MKKNLRKISLYILINARFVKFAHGTKWKSFFLTGFKNPRHFIDLQVSVDLVEQSDRTTFNLGYGFGMYRQDAEVTYYLHIYILYTYFTYFIHF